LNFESDVAWLLKLLGYQVGSGTTLCAEAMERSATLGKCVKVCSQVRIGKNVKVSDDTVLRQRAILSTNVLIGKNCIIGESAQLENIIIGDGSMIEFEVLCIGYGKGLITIGRQCYIGLRNVLDWSDNITIGNFVHIAGPSTALWTHSSVYQALRGNDLNDKTQRTTAPVSIEDNVYIGGNCTIYPGVNIGHHSIVLPNSAVNANVPVGVMVGGVPAKVIQSLEIG
jgi:acetyltransferase-like isoleucine patch superfamily enzyme